MMMMMLMMLLLLPVVVVALAVVDIQIPKCVAKCLDKHRCGHVPNAWVHTQWAHRYNRPRPLSSRCALLEGPGAAASVNCKFQEQMNMNGDWVPCVGCLQPRSHDEKRSFVVAQHVVVDLVVVAHMRDKPNDGGSYRSRMKQGGFLS